MNLNCLWNYILLVYLYTYLFVFKSGHWQILIVIFYSLSCLPNLSTRVIWTLNLHWVVSVAGEKIRRFHVASQAVVPPINCPTAFLELFHLFISFPWYEAAMVSLPYFATVHCAYIDAISYINSVHFTTLFFKTLVLHVFPFSVFK